MSNFSSPSPSKRRAKILPPLSIFQIKIDIFLNQFL